MLLLCAALSLLAPPQDPEPAALWPSGIERPSLRGDGSLLCSIGGDIWSREGGRWVRWTAGEGRDHEPCWARAGGGVLFSSRRGEGSVPDLYRLTEPGGDPERLTRDGGSWPVALSDGSIAFCRGPVGGRDLFLRRPDGRVLQLAALPGEDEHSPSVGGEGVDLVYLRGRTEVHRLRMKPAEDGAGLAAQDEVLLEDRGLVYAVARPESGQLAWTRRGGEGSGVWVADYADSYRHQVSRLIAAAAWAPEGGSLVLATLPGPEPGYNGDPQRLPDTRRYPARTGDHRQLFEVPVPAAPDAARSAFATAEAAGPSASEELLRRSQRMAESYPSGAERDRFLQYARQLGEELGRAGDDVAAQERVLWRLERDRPPLRREVRGRAAVSSAHPEATAAGLEVLEAGGNVVDAAVAVSFALGVVEPDASGIGGYGEMLVYLPGMTEPTCIEFMTRVPGAYEELRGRRDLHGAQRVNVPGTVDGMALAKERYGSESVAWAQLLEPARRLAAEGFVLDDAFTTTLRRERSRFADSAAAQALWFPDGVPLGVGERVLNPDLAQTLEELAAEPRAFYEGAVAERILADLRAHGSVLTENDFATYRAVEREAVRSVYRGHTVYGGAAPVTGGVSLAGKLTLLDQAEVPGDYREDAASLHRMIEAWKLAPSSRGRIADPGIWPVDYAPFQDAAAAAKLWQEAFDPQRALDGEQLRKLRERVAVAELPAPALPGRTQTGTTAFVVVDGSGAMVSVTQTLGTWGGNFHVSPGVGVLYNDKLRAPRGDNDRYGATVPFSRVGTVIAPTLLFRGEGEERRPFAALGAAGNSWITAAVYQMTHGLIDRGLGPQAALELPRFLVSGGRGGSGGVVQMEDGMAPTVLRALRDLGHRDQPISLPGELRMGYGAAALIEDGAVRAGADPRRSGRAGALR